MCVTVSAASVADECAFVLERSRAGAHQAGQAIGHGGPDGQGAADIGGGQEELGRVVGLEAGGVRASRRPPTSSSSA